VNQIASTEVGLIAQHVVTHAHSHADDALVPVGRCPEGVRVEILRDDGSVAAADEVGEMIVSSEHVSPGYWRRPELGALAFSVDPRDARMRRYASGDVGRIGAEGNLHFLGRKGGRVKIHGHSVELMEVEAAVASCAGVDKVAVLAQRGDGDTVRLTAFVVPQAGVARDALALRRELATRSPAYMLPSRRAARSTARRWRGCRRTDPRRGTSQRPTTTSSVRSPACSRSCSTSSRSAATTISSCWAAIRCVPRSCIFGCASASA
jgi:acyl-coenzyme A synthetase/AMP-(fatty) acid ligase